MTPARLATASRKAAAMKIVKRPAPARTEQDQALTAAAAELAMSEQLRAEAAEHLAFLRGYLACLEAMTPRPRPEASESHPCL